MLLATYLINFTNILTRTSSLHFPCHHVLQSTCFTILQSVDNFFAFFHKDQWDVEIVGPPPTLDAIDWTYEDWAKHARYADKTGIPPTDKHYYWQSGASQQEVENPKKTWGFIGRDLPSFSDINANFFKFLPEKSKGIQCRFGERVRFKCDSKKFNIILLPLIVRKIPFFFLIFELFMLFNIHQGVAAATHYDGGR